MVRSFLALYRVDGVIDASQVLTVELALPGLKYPTPEQRIDFYRRLDDRLSATPGLSAATVASARPFVRAPARLLSLAAHPTVAGDRLPSVSTVAISPHYFDTLRLRVVRGRPLTYLDGTPGHEAAIVNQRFADTYFPNENAVGQRIRLTVERADPASVPWLTIVGVSPTIRQSIASAARPVVYLPLRSYSDLSAAIVVGGLMNPTAATPTLRTAVASLDADVTLFNVRPLAYLLDDSRLQHRLIGTLLAIFAGIALILSMLGMYAVTAYAVRQRTHEIGVRIALGARSQQVVWLFVRRAMVPLGTGVLVGLGGALVAGRLLQTLLIETSATDSVTLVASVALLVCVAVMASFVPARRAARLDPLEVLRYE